MCNVMDVDIPIVGAAYMFLIIIIGQFFLLNLFLAVIVFAFVKSQQEDVHSQVEHLKADAEARELERAKRKE